MLGLFQRMRRDEDGQTLVLAAISMLVLALCVMATVNIGQATYEKVKLQNAADAAAYSLATVEAEGFNFFAYTNRAMLCHYASMLTFLAYDSFILYMDHTWGRLMGILKFIPYIGVVFAVLKKILDVATMIIDKAVAILVVVLGVLNYAYFFFQTAMAVVMEATIANPSILQTDDPDASSYKGLGVLAKVMNAAMLFKAIDMSSIEKLASMSNKINGNDGRKLMADLVNSTRHPWVAGTSHDVKLFGRNWSIDISVPIPLFSMDFKLTKSSRTEDGMMAGGAASKHDQLYSVDAFQLMFSAHILSASIRIGFGYISEVWADKKKGAHREGLLDVNGRLWGTGLARCSPDHWWHWTSPVGKATCAAVNVLIKPITPPWAIAVRALEAYIKAEESNTHHHFYLGTTPFMKFKPEAKWRSAFNEPDYLVAASMTEDDLDKHFFGSSTKRSTFKLGWPVAGTAADRPKEGTDAELNFRHKKAGSKGPLGFLAPGFTAIAASRTYYHRPGDWREHPNFFNPFWGARLEPIAAHQGVAMLHLPGPVSKFITH